MNNRTTLIALAACLTATAMVPAANAAQFLGQHFTNNGLQLDFGNGIGIYDTFAPINYCLALTGSFNVGEGNLYHNDRVTQDGTLTVPIPGVSVSLAAIPYVNTCLDDAPIIGSFLGLPATQAIAVCDSQVINPRPCLLVLGSTFNPRGLISSATPYAQSLATADQVLKYTSCSLNGLVADTFASPPSQPPQWEPGGDLQGFVAPGVCPAQSTGPDLAPTYWDTSGDYRLVPVTQANLGISQGHHYVVEQCLATVRIDLAPVASVTVTDTDVSTVVNVADISNTADDLVLAGWLAQLHQSSNADPDNVDLFGAKCALPAANPVTIEPFACTATVTMQNPTGAGETVQIQSQCVGTGNCASFVIAPAAVDPEPAVPPITGPGRRVVCTVPAGSVLGACLPGKAVAADAAVVPTTGRVTADIHCNGASVLLSGHPGADTVVSNPNTQTGTKTTGQYDCVMTFTWAAGAKAFGGTADCRDP